MIKITKLITGEELIADVTENELTTVFKQPCAIQLMPDHRDPSKTMMGLIPYATYTEDFEVEVRNENIIWSANPTREVYNQYNQTFGSGIQLAGL